MENKMKVLVLSLNDSKHNTSTKLDKSIKTEASARISYSYKNSSQFPELDLTFCTSNKFKPDKWSSKQGPLNVIDLLKIKSD